VTGVVFVSVTRLRLRSPWHLFALAWDTSRVNRQVKAADGCLRSDVRREPGNIFWTKTLWRDEASMRAFMASGAHLKAMPKLKHWCDEASAAHWSQDSPDVTWAEAEGGMAQYGWTSKVLRPSPAHVAGSPLGSPK
jgi:quinol monooxygenase YgiN